MMRAYNQGTNQYKRKIESMVIVILIFVLAAIIVFLSINSETPESEPKLISDSLVLTEFGSRPVLSPSALYPPSESRSAVGEYAHINDVHIEINVISDGVVKIETVMPERPILPTSFLMPTWTSTPLPEPPTVTHTNLATPMPTPTYIIMPVQHPTKIPDPTPTFFTVLEPTETPLFRDQG